jgi:hypothetical protein
LTLHKYELGSLGEPADRKDDDGQGEGWDIRVEKWSRHRRTRSSLSEGTWAGDRPRSSGTCRAAHSPRPWRGARATRRSLRSRSSPGRSGCGIGGPRAGGGRGGSTRDVVGRSVGQGSRVVRGALRPGRAVWRCTSVSPDAFRAR